MLFRGWTNTWKIANIKETQEELKKEVDSLVLEHLKQQQQTSKALNIQESLQTLTRKVTQLETTLEQVKSNVESLESIIGQLEEEQLHTKSNLEKNIRSTEKKQGKLEEEFQESIENRCMEAVQWWMSIIQTT